MIYIKLIIILVDYLIMNVLSNILLCVQESSGL